MVLVNTLEHNYYTNLGVGAIETSLMESIWKTLVLTSHGYVVI